LAIYDIFLCACVIKAKKLDEVDKELRDIETRLEQDKLGEFATVVLWFDIYLKRQNVTASPVQLLFM